MPTHPHMRMVFGPGDRAIRKVLRGTATPEDALEEGRHRFEDVTRPLPAPRPPEWGLMVLGLLTLLGVLWMAKRLREPGLEAHPSDPLVPVARLGLGRVLLANGDIERAIALFAQVATSEDERVAEAGRFHQGVSLHLAQRHAEALALLEPLVGRTTDPDESVLLLRTLAAAAQREGRTEIGRASCRERV